MTTCDYCHQQSKLIFTCLHCERHYCKDHRKPENHECISINKNEDKLFEESTEVEHVNTVNLQNTSDLFNSNNESDFVSDEVFLKINQENLKTTQESVYLSDDEKEIDLSIHDQEILVKKVQEEKDNDATIFVDTRTKPPLTNVIRKEAFLVIMLLFGIIVGQMITSVLTPNEYDENLQQRYDKIYDYYVEMQGFNVELNLIVDNLTNDIVSVENQLNQVTIEYNQLLAQYQSLNSEQKVQVGS